MVTLCNVEWLLEIGTDPDRYQDNFLGFLTAVLKKNQTPSFGT